MKFSDYGLKILLAEGPQTMRAGSPEKPWLRRLAFQSVAFVNLPWPQAEGFGAVVWMRHHRARVRLHNSFGTCCHSCFSHARGAAHSYVICNLVPEIVTAKTNSGSRQWCQSECPGAKIARRALVVARRRAVVTTLFHPAVCNLFNLFCL